MTDLDWAVREVTADEEIPEPDAALEAESDPDDDQGEDDGAAQ